MKSTLKTLDGLPSLKSSDADALVAELTPEIASFKRMIEFDPLSAPFTKWSVKLRSVVGWCFGIPLAIGVKIIKHFNLHIRFLELRIAYDDPGQFLFGNKFHLQRFYVRRKLLELFLVRCFLLAKFGFKAPDRLRNRDREWLNFPSFVRRCIHHVEFLQCVYQDFTNYKDSFAQDIKGLPSKVMFDMRREANDKLPFACQVVAQKSIYTDLMVSTILHYAKWLNRIARCYQRKNPSESLKFTEDAELALMVLKRMGV